MGLYIHFVKTGYANVARSTVHAEVGDVRLVGQSTVSNWLMGRLEVFFEGSWGQVCANAFGGADAAVACRQLGFGAGTVASNLAVGGQDVLVYPEVALTLPGCAGTEARLLDCGSQGEDSSAISRRFASSRGCFEDTAPGLIVACVVQPENSGGVLTTPVMVQLCR